MNEILLRIAAGIAGGLLGAIFFGGLWWTVRKGIASERPAFWFFGSLMTRMSIALIGFYFVSGSHWDRTLASLLGFVIARLIVSQRTKRLEANTPGAAWEARHASQP
ncbi:F1F0 ATPase [Capsulimonas corticalis]|uniref:F1F0 ATPase n=1 Tax=Capsulimonas corticalis TaxID=2219043 RepID=A0A402CXZ0_9BACT|nr:ATP synthase subunit I [Capsulimonas corticalis]BDI32109.1 F1F0 ATPase [Capsulimonas corticalis]